MPSEAFYRSAAKTAWVAPLVAIFVNYCNHASPSAVNQSPRYQLVGLFITVVLTLIGFVSGIFALRGIGRYRRASIIVPAILGVSFNSLVILTFLMVVYSGSKVSTASAANRQRQQHMEFAQGAEEGRRSFTEYGGWFGNLATSSAGVVVTSWDDRSPSARRILDDLPVPCSVLMIVARPARGKNSVALEPSSLTMEFADGHIVHALDGDSILSRSKNDPKGVMRRFNAACRSDPTQDVYGAISFIPAGTDLPNLRSVTFRVNGKPMTIHGRFLSAKERRAMLPGN
jgi:hypothetical protein